MEADDLLCLRNVWSFHRLRLRLRLSSDQSCLGVFFPPQPRPNPWPANEMRAVKGSLGHSLKERYRGKVNL
jgi:hypothetical protein